MNAYELADELENYVWINPNNNRDYCKEVKNMLRQQADRIAQLEMLVANRNEIIDKLDLNPQTNAGAVAWMHKNPDYPISKHWSLEYNIPLYTTPQTKPLSRGEIVELLKNVNLFNLEEVTRAIEERHGIK